MRNMKLKSRNLEKSWRTNSCRMSNRWHNSRRRTTMMSSMNSKTSLTSRGGPSDTFFFKTVSKPALNVLFDISNYSQKTK